MKLLFAIKNLNSAMGGAERVFCAVCTELVGRGHEVTIVTFDQSNALPAYYLDRRINRINLGIGDSSRNANLKETIQRSIALRRLVKLIRPDVVIGFMHSMFVPLSFAMLGLRIPLIGSEHIVVEHYKTRPLQFVLFLLVSPFLAKITVLSERVKVRYPNVLRRRMVVVPNPVMNMGGQLNHYANKSRFILLNVGRLVLQKDHKTLLVAFAKIAGAFPKWDLRIIGDGPLRERLEKCVSELGLGNRVSLPGVTNEIETEYREADIFVMSSRYESFGLVTAEAMLFELPVIGFADCPGTNELIQHNKTGILVDPGKNRVLSLANELKRILSDATLRKRLGKAAKRNIEGTYSIEQICDLWEEMLYSFSFGNETTRLKR